MIAAPSRATVVDTAAAVLFFTVAATLSERFVAGLDWDQVAASRLAALPAMALTGRPYGLWRDRVMAWGGADRRSPAARAALDIAAFVAFQVPVYALILVAAGADGPQIAAAVGGALVMMVALSRPYGLYLERARALFGVARPPALE